MRSTHPEWIISSTLSGEAATTRIPWRWIAAKIPGSSIRANATVTSQPDSASARDRVEMWVSIPPNEAGRSAYIRMRTSLVSSWLQVQAYRIGSSRGPPSPWISDGGPLELSLREAQRGLAPGPQRSIDSSLFEAETGARTRPVHTGRPIRDIRWGRPVRTQAAGDKTELPAPQAVP